MRIAIVAHSFPQVSETFILNHVTGLMDLGHDVDIFVFGKTKTGELYRRQIEQYKLLEKIYLYQFPKNKIRRILTGFFELIKLLFIKPGAIQHVVNFKKFGKFESVNNLIKLQPFLRKKYDCLHCHFGPNGNNMVFLKNILPEMKFLVTFHGYDIRLGLQEGGHIYQELFSKADHIISICHYNYNHLVDFGCPENKIINLLNGVDLNKFKPVPRQNSSVFMLTTVARLVEEKNLFYALQIMKRLKEITSRKFLYQIIGDGPLKEDLLQAIKELGLNDTVKLLGAQPQHKIIEYLNETDVFLFPSRHEAFGVALLEAQAMEVSVVACDVGGVASAMIDQETGFLVPLNDVDYAVKTIDRLFNDELLRQRMGKAGRLFVERNCNIKNINRKLEGIYLNNVHENRAFKYWSLDVKGAKAT